MLMWLANQDILEYLMEWPCIACKARYMQMIEVPASHESVWSIK
jgi:hypothetical protein